MLLSAWQEEGRLLVRLWLRVFRSCAGAHGWQHASDKLCPSGRCDQEVSGRIPTVPHKIREEVSNKETRNQFEPDDVSVSLPRRADEQSEVRSSGDNVPLSASLDVERD